MKAALSLLLICSVSANIRAVAFEYRLETLNTNLQNLKKSLIKKSGGDDSHKPPSNVTNIGQDLFKYFQEQPGVANPDSTGVRALEQNLGVTWFGMVENLPDFGTQLNEFINVAKSNQAHTQGARKFAHLIVSFDKFFGEDKIKTLKKAVNSIKNFAVAKNWASITAQDKKSVLQSLDNLSKVLEQAKLKVNAFYELHKDEMKKVPLESADFKITTLPVKTTADQAFEALVLLPLNQHATPLTKYDQHTGDELGWSIYQAQTRYK